MKWEAVTVLVLSIHVIRGDPRGDYEWLRNATSDILRTQRATGEDGIVLLTPGGHYKGQWMRDSYYGFSSGWELLPNHTEALVSLEYMLSKTRESDGTIPQMVDLAGNPSYGMRDCKVVLDEAQFAVLQVELFSRRFEGGSEIFIKWAPVLDRAMLATPLDKGLVYIDPNGPHCVGYGFTDTVSKNGHVLYASVLYYMAAGAMAELHFRHGNASAGMHYMELQRGIAAGLESILWDETAGFYRADDSIDSKLYDIWGSAYAATVRISGEEERVMRVANELSTRASSIFFQGQVRELPSPQMWANSSTAAGFYQNGGYWGTPLHHTLPLLGRAHHSQACSLLADVVASFKLHNCPEWWGNDMTGQNPAVPYVASAANALAAAELLRCWE